MKSIPWLIFLGLIASLTLGYTGFFLVKFYDYAILTKQVPSTSVQWSIHSHDEDVFSAQADYTYTFEGKQYEGRTQWDDGERYPNPYALEKLMNSLSTQDWQVWLNAWDPADSSLQKKFPTKECLSTVILWLVFAYFVMLGKYAKRKGNVHANYKVGKPLSRRRAAASDVSSGTGDDPDQL